MKTNLNQQEARLESFINRLNKLQVQRRKTHAPARMVMVESDIRKQKQMIHKKKMEIQKLKMDSGIE